MPRLQSGVWKHFTPTVRDGRETFVCNYCSRTYSKNATKMQMHLDKCKDYSVATQCSPGADGSSSASIPVPSSSFLPSATPGGGQFLIDSVDQGSQAFADECLARAVYATSSPLSLTASVYWRRFFGVLRPAYCPPTQQALSSHLLDCEYNRVQSQIHETIGKADCVAIVCSGWSKETRTVNYVVTTPLPLYYRSTQIKEPIHVSVSIAEDLKEIINEVGPEKVFAVVTDNAPDTRLAWPQIEDAFPHVSAIGCVALCLRQLLDELAAQPSMAALCRRAEHVVRYVRERPALAETFAHWQATKISNHAATGTALVPPDRSSADWTGVINMYNSLLEGQNSLQEMAVSATLDIEAPVRATLQDAVFWKGISGSQGLLCLVGNHIDHVKREDAVLSDVVEAFSQLRYHMGAALAGSALHGGEQKAALASLDRCQEACVRPVHAAAYMLDPKHVGQQTLSAEQISGAYYVISSLSHHLHLDEGKVLAGFARFSTKQGLWKGDGIWSSCQHISAATWWTGLCSSEPLATVASAILRIPPTTGACDRLCAQTGDVNTRGGGGGGGSLSAERLQKLAAIQATLRVLEPSDHELVHVKNEVEEKVKFDI